MGKAKDGNSGELSMKLLFLCLSLFLLPISSARAAPGEREEQVQQSALECANFQTIEYIESRNTLCLKGQIDISGKMRERIESFPLRHDVLVVLESQGGGLMEAIRITEHLEKLDYDVAVSGMCLSACSQFIFMGAREKFFTKDGLIAFHGGPIPEEKIAKMELPEKGKDNLRREQVVFRQFYCRRGIDLDLVSTVPERIGGVEEHRQFWVPTLAELSRAGVDQVYDLGSEIMR